jgi:hypothetical protein
LLTQCVLLDEVVRQHQSTIPHGGPSLALCCARRVLRNKQAARVVVIAQHHLALEQAVVAHVLGALTAVVAARWW